MARDGLRRRPGRGPAAERGRAGGGGGRAKEEGAERGGPPGAGLGAVGAALVLVRLASAAVAIVHDCDEVFNYWEPLHHLVYGGGLRTWEYSSEVRGRRLLRRVSPLPPHPPRRLRA